MTLHLRRLAQGTILGVAVVIVALSFAVPRAQKKEGPVGPSTWVAFTADMVRTAPGGVTYGRLYRGGDGSSRLESGLARTEMTLIDIKNGLGEASDATGW
jgi:hypothetical protein